MAFLIAMTACISDLSITVYWQFLFYFNARYLLLMLFNRIIEDVKNGSNSVIQTGFCFQIFLCFGILIYPKASKPYRKYRKMSIKIKKVS